MAKLAACGAHVLMSKAPGLSSASPSPTCASRSIDLADGVLTVDLSKEFVATNADAPAMRRRLAQLAFTLTQFESVAFCAGFVLDGQPTATFGTSGLTLDGPLDLSGLPHRDAADPHRDRGAR